MRLELVLRPAAPLSRSTCDDHVRARLRGVVARGPDLEGKIGQSAEARTKPFFAKDFSGEIDRAKVETLELAIDWTDERDIDPIVLGLAGGASPVGRSPPTGQASPRDDSARSRRGANFTSAASAVARRSSCPLGPRFGDA